MRVVDLFCGGGGFSCGATQAGAEVVLSVEWDAKIAAIYKANFPPGERHEVRVEELGGDPESMASEIRAMIKEDEEPLHVHGSPPCQKLSNISMQRMNVAEGMRLVRWFLDVVEASKPPSWTMEQVPHPKLLEYLTQRGIAWHVVTASDHGVPQKRRRVIAGTPEIIAALQRAEGSGPTAVPRHYFPDLQPPERFRLQNGTDNQSLYGGGYRKFLPGEGTRSLDEPCHTILARGKRLRIYDTQTKDFLRKITHRECATLQGFPDDFKFAPEGGREFKTRTMLIAGNAVPPPLAKSIMKTAMEVATKQRSTDD